MATKKTQQIIPVLMALALGALSGIIIITSPLFSFENDNSIFVFAGLFLLVYLAMMVQVIVHEAGHLIFGLATGYRFSSFRIGSLLFMRENGKLKMKKFMVIGPLGQCLLLPPVDEEGKMPKRFSYALYNMGGVIMNILLCVICVLLYLLLSYIPVLSELFLMLSLVGVYFALTNSMPWGIGDATNDGKNLLLIRKSERAKRYFWLQLEINGRQFEGERLCDMPSEYFPMPDKEEDDVLAAASKLLVYFRLVDKGDTVGAKALLLGLLAQDIRLIPAHRALVISDMIFWHLLDGESYAHLLSKDQKKYMSAMGGSLSIVRTEYALALLGDKDAEKAAKLKRKFEKAAKTHPCKPDIEIERELLALADAKSANKF